jgi:hypothetical protein
MNCPKCGKEMSINKYKVEGSDQPDYKCSDATCTYKRVGKNWVLNEYVRDGVKKTSRTSEWIPKDDPVKKFVASLDKDNQQTQDNKRTDSIKWLNSINNAVNLFCRHPFFADIKTEQELKNLLSLWFNWFYAKQPLIQKDIEQKNKEQKELEKICDEVNF